MLFSKGTVVELTVIQTKVKHKIREISDYLIDLRNENSELKARLRKMERCRIQVPNRELLKSEIFMV